MVGRLRAFPNPVPKARPESDDEDELPKLKKPFFFFLFFFEPTGELRRFAFGGGALKKPPKKPDSGLSVLGVSTKEPEETELFEER